VAFYLYGGGGGAAIAIGREDKGLNVNPLNKKVIAGLIAHTYLESFHDNELVYVYSCLIGAFISIFIFGGC
jgi:hypothetical protein